MSDMEKPSSPSAIDAVVGYINNDKAYDVAIAGLLLTQGVPIPPSIVKRIRVGLGRLIDGSFDVLEGGLTRNDRGQLEFAPPHISAKVGAGDTALSRPVTAGGGA